jgi:FkbM family methyltransferase
MKHLGLLQRLIRLYTFYSPIRKGKYRLALAGLDSASNLPKQVQTKTTDNRNIIVNPTTFTYQFVYFLGEYEPAITNVISKIVRKDDVCFDIGANIGWYTTLMQTLVSDKGIVHAFEPVPSSIETLKTNISLNKNADKVVLNEFALGDSEKVINIYNSATMPDGHASISKSDNEDVETISISMKTTDWYVQTNNIKEVNFIKLDIEGAELFMLKGASALFRQERPPIWVIEMALDTSKKLGYLPNDLIQLMQSQADYDFFAIDTKTYILKKISAFAKDDIGANVLCVPSKHYKDRLAALKIEN